MPVISAIKTVIKCHPNFVFCIIFVLSLLLLFYILLLLVFPPKQPFFVELSRFTEFGWINSPINDKRGRLS